MGLILDAESMDGDTRQKADLIVAGTVADIAGRGMDI
jgi:hypothetical protein